MRWLTNFYDFEFKWTATAGIGIHPTKVWLSELVNFKNAIKTLKEWYAIKFCFKLGKNATETYGMLQTAFRPSCINRASVFEWHNRFKEGRESVRDDERCVRSKEVRTPEFIGQIKNFMDKDCRVSIETISAQFDVSVGTVHTIIREEPKMQKICAKFVPRVLREDQKDVITAGRWLSWSIQIPQFSMLWWPVMKAGCKRQSSQWKHAGSPRPKKARQSKSTHKLLMISFFDSTGMIYMHWVPTGQTVNKEYYVEVLREFRKKFRQKRPVLFKSGQ